MIKRVLKNLSDRLQVIDYLAGLGQQMCVQPSLAREAGCFNHIAKHPHFRVSG